MPRLSQASLETVRTAPLGPGAVIANVKPPITIEAIEGILTKSPLAEETGYSLGAMTSVPNVATEPDIVNILEDVQGVNTVLKGAQQPQAYGITAEAEIVEVRPETINAMLPGLVQADYMNGDATPAKIGESFRLKGYFDDSDYIPNLNFVFESSVARALLIITLFNCIQTDATELTGGEGGQAGGIACTWTAHCGDEDFDPTTGTYLPPAEYNWLTPPVVVP